MFKSFRNLKEILMAALAASTFSFTVWLVLSILFAHVPNPW